MLFRSFLCEREIEVAVSLGARHQRHGLRQQRLVVGSRFELAAEEFFEILAACRTTQTERGVELCLVLVGIGILFEERRQTVVLGDDLVGQHLVSVLVVVAEVAEISHDGFGIGIVAAGLDCGTERFTDTLAVVGLVAQELACFLIENESGTLLGMVSEILGLRYVNAPSRMNLKKRKLQTRN